MKPEQKKYILENVEKKSIEELSKELGVKERKITKLLKRIKEDKIVSPEKSTTQKTKYSKKSEILIFIAIFAAALLVRVIYLNQIKTSPFFTPFYHGLDDYLYDSWAQSIAQGNVLGSEVFYGLPLYPYFLGFVYFLFGHSVYMAKLIQLVMGSLSCGLVYLVGRRVFNRTVGIIASVILTFYAMSIYFEGQFVSSSLAIFLNLGIILFLLSINNNAKPAKWIITGLLIGAASLVNASILIFVPFIILWMVKVLDNVGKSKIVKNLVLLFLGIFLVIAPVTLRNYVVAKDFVPVTAHSGITFYAGNNPGSDGTFHMPKEIGTSVVDSKENAQMIAEHITKKNLKPSEISNFWFNQATQFIKREPERYLNLLLRKMFLFWNVYEIPDIMPMEFFKQYAPLLKLPLFGFAVICPLALVGMVLSLKSRNTKVLLLEFFIGSVFLSTTIYFVNSRYRLIAVPYLAIFAAFTIYWIYEKVKERQMNKTIAPAVALILIVAITHIKILEFGMAQSHNNLGIILKRQKLYKEAIVEYNKAIRENPNYDSPYFNLGLLYRETGNNKKALECFNKALDVNPNLIKAHQQLVELYQNSGQYKKAEHHKKRLINSNPSYLK